MATSLSDNLRNIILTQIVNAAGGTSFLLVFTGGKIGKTGSAFNDATGTLLAAFPLPNPIGTISAGVLTLGTIANVTAPASGTPGNFRISTSSSTAAGNGAFCIWEGTAGVGTGDLNFASAISQNAAVSISSFVATEGNP